MIESQYYANVATSMDTLRKIVEIRKGHKLLYNIKSKKQAKWWRHTEKCGRRLRFKY